MIKLILITLLTIASVDAKMFTGVAVGHHLNGEKLYDIHPYIGTMVGNIGGMVYINSFKKVGFAAFYEFADHANKDVQFNLKLGATTGYNPRMRYNGHTYGLERKFFFNNDIMLLIIPGISFYMDQNDSIDLTLLGDSLNIGVTFRF